MTPRRTLIVMATVNALLLAAAALVLSNTTESAQVSPPTASATIVVPHLSTQPLEAPLQTVPAEVNTSPIVPAFAPKVRSKPKVQTTHVKHDDLLRIYDVAWLLANIGIYRAVEAGAPDEIEDRGISIEDFVEVIESAVTPDDWDLPGRTITGVGTSLIVRAPKETHERIAALLADLNQN